MLHHLAILRVTPFDAIPVAVSFRCSALTSQMATISTRGKTVALANGGSVSEPNLTEISVPRAIALAAA